MITAPFVTFDGTTTEDNAGRSIIVEVETLVHYLQSGTWGEVFRKVVGNFGSFNSRTVGHGRYTIAVPSTLYFLADVAT